MRPSKKNIIIATRRSQLATAQSTAMGKHIHQAHPNVELQMHFMDSEGDQVTDHPLAQFGGKGLFTRSIEAAVIARQANLAIHSLKDLPTALPPELCLAAIPKRLPPHDVLIAPSADRIEDLPQGAVIGTCSPRRAAQLKRLRPDFQIKPLRGNVDTRIKRVIEDKAYDATLLAAAGLMRLGLKEYTTKPIPVEQVLPAVGQAALAVQCRRDDHVSLRRVLPFNHAITAHAINAERLIAQKLGADCHSPIAVLAEPIDPEAPQQFRLRVRVLSLDGVTCLEIDTTGSIQKLSRLCETASQSLIDQGARALLAEAAQG